MRNEVHVRVCCDSLRKLWQRVMKHLIDFKGSKKGQGGQLKRVGKVPEWQILQQRGNIAKKNHRTRLEPTDQQSEKKIAIYMLNMWRQPIDAQGNMPQSSLS